MDRTATPSLARGTQLGRYEIEDSLGTGGLATVYRARDLESGTRVALKRPAVTGDVARWEIEARLLSELDHPGVVSLVDHFEEPTGTYNIVMRLVDGIDLARLQWDRGTPGLPVDDVLPWMFDACDSLHYLHGQGIVHGDVKPRNMVRGRERVTLVDFGLAARVGANGGARGGTPRYMAPEVYAGQPPSPLSDIYGLTASAWALITGNAPAYGHDRAPEALAGIESGLAAALRGGLAFRPEERIDSAGALASALGGRVRSGAGASLGISDPVLDARRSLLESIVRAVAGSLGAAAASVALFEPRSRTLRYVAAWGAGASQIVGVELGRGVGVAGAVATSGRPEAIPRCRNDARFAAAVASRTGHVPYTMIVVPLLHDGATIGVLSVLDRRDGEPYRTDDIPRVELFADVVVSALTSVLNRAEEPKPWV
jgi:eukaryotic-like serine/threonine-protein kinase